MIVVGALTVLTGFAGVQVDESLVVRVLDTGPGLCCLIRIPATSGYRYVIYDAGNRQKAASVLRSRIKEFIPVGSTISLMVLSHSDADHVGMVPEICDWYEVKRIIRPGIEGRSQTWQNAVAAIEDESDCDDINLATTDLNEGKRYFVGDATIRFLCGFSTPPEDWDLISDAERNNAGSIIVRLVCNGRSILFTGDAVGRHSGDADQYACIATEAHLLDVAESYTIRSRVLIAPHHGADNGSSLPFITEVNPYFVVFSAGHDYEHPRYLTVQRYQTIGLTNADMFRTDLGDDEGDIEWAFGRQTGNVDRAGDDDIDITIDENTEVSVAYR